MIRRTILMSICFITCFMLCYFGSCINFSGPQISPISSDAFQLATVPGSSDPSGDEWPMLGGQLNHTGVAYKSPTTYYDKIFWYNTTKTARIYLSSPAVVGGRVYISSEDGQVYCLSAATGNILWNQSAGASVSYSPAVADGRLYVSGNLDCKLYCFNATTGVPLWTYNPNGYVSTSPAVVGGRVYVGCAYEGKIACVNATTGVSIWNYTTEGVGIESSAPAVVGDRLYIGEWSGKIYCLNAITGASVWNHTIGGPLSTAPVVAGGRVYLGSRDWKVYCLSAITGQPLWNYTAEYEIWSPPAVWEGRIYVGSLDYNVYCLNSTTGGLFWKYFTEGSVYSSPAVQGGRVYISGAFKLYCLNAITGVSLWNYSTGGFGSSPAIVGGRVYIGCTDWKIYCLPTILDPNPTTYTAVVESADPLELGDTETIMVTGVEDLSGIQTFWIEFEGGNHTMTNIAESTWNYRYWTPDNPGTCPYTIYIQDNCGIWISISGEIQVVAPTFPSYTAVIESADLLELGCTEEINITGVADLSGIQTIQIAFEGSNHTMIAFGGGTWGCPTWIPPSVGTYAYAIYIQDTIGNWNATSGEIHVVDTIPPTYTLVIEFADPLVLGSTATIMITGVADFSGVQTVLINFEGINSTMTNLGGGIWSLATWMPSSAGTYSYTIYSQDTLGRWNAVNGEIQVIDTSNPLGDSLIWILIGFLIGIVIFTIFNHLRWHKKFQNLSSSKTSPPKDLPKKVASQ